MNKKWKVGHYYFVYGTYMKVINITKSGTPWVRCMYERAGKNMQDLGEMSLMAQLFMYDAKEISKLEGLIKMGI
jgi:hypothetical protein